MSSALQAHWSPAKQKRDSNASLNLRISGNEDPTRDLVSESELASQQASDVASQQRRPNKSTGFALARPHSCHLPPFVYILAVTGDE
jgi:hypothetical protein